MTNKLQPDFCIFKWYDNTCKYFTVTGIVFQLLDKYVMDINKKNINICIYLLVKQHMINQDDQKFNEIIKQKLSTYKNCSNMLDEM